MAKGWLSGVQQRVEPARAVQRHQIIAAADVPTIEIMMVPEADDRVNVLGIKGIGEIGIVGMNAAVANAVYNATGKRIRALPIRPEKLL